MKSISSASGNLFFRYRYSAIAEPTASPSGLICVLMPMRSANIDHHISNQNGCGDINVVKPKVGSTSEVLFGLMDEAYLDKDIAVALYTGIIFSL